MGIPVKQLLDVAQMSTSQMHSSESIVEGKTKQL